MSKEYIDLMIEVFVDELKYFNHYFNVIRAEINEKGKCLEDEFKRISPQYDPEFTDESEVWSQAYQNVFGTDNFPLDFHLPSMTAGFCIIIYHAFERFLEEIFEQLKISNLEHLKSISIDPNKVVLGDKLEKFQNFVDIFPQIKTLSSYKELNELRLVCNVFKHGTGPSMTQLKAERPDMFKWSSLFDYTNIRPLAGMDINISENDFSGYLKAINLFLEEVFKYSKN